MSINSLEKLTIYIIALLVLALFSGELSAMVAISSHDCQGESCIESVNSE